MPRTRTILLGLIALTLVAVFGYEAVKWTIFRVYVPHDKALLVINKFGNPLPPERNTVPTDEQDYKGVQEEVLGPGRYFLDPIRYDYKLVDQVVISPGDPQQWKFDPDGKLVNPETAPMVGLVALKEGKPAAAGRTIVGPDEKGIQREVLTPGTYKLNPVRYEVTKVPAVVVPPGFVGVVTQLEGDASIVPSAPLTQVIEETAPSTQQSDVDQSVAPAPRAPRNSRLVVGEDRRGVLDKVLQPGIYYLNPRVVKVNIEPVGYDAIALQAPENPIRFYSFDGYQVEADFTVVWGRNPADAPQIVANIGDTDRVRENVIEPAMKAACQNEGAKYTARELIQGDTRSKFQDDLSASLERQVASRNVHVLLALVRNITIRDNSGKDQTDGLLATIQRANIEIERELTNRQKTETAVVSASLEEASKLVDVAREEVASTTKVKVANLLADGQKQAAEIDATRERDVAVIELQIAQLDAERNLILGQAQAEVEKLKKDAQAEGAKLLIDAFGSPLAYNQYIFAKNFDPTDIRLIFAGPGTFWTDLKTFEQAGAAKLLAEEDRR